jgi:SAM-dependent methyltransferase
MGRRDEGGPGDGPGGRAGTAGRFDDHFSQLAAGYSRHRPNYPDELIELVAAAAPGRQRAWDAGTGSGQAAVGLAAHFEEVVATDGSAEQIARAVPHPRVTYRVEVAERTTIPDRSVDLVTAAQAAHWFKVDDFYAEVRRVLRPGGIVALWCYGLESVSHEVDAVVQRLYVELLGPYWPKRTIVDHTYQDIPFPFDELPRRVFMMERTWTLHDLVNGFRTWSAALRYRQDRGVDPLDELAEPLSRAWGDPDEPRRVTWPVYLRYGAVRTGS